MTDQHTANPDNSNHQHRLPATGTVATKQPRRWIRYVACLLIVTALVLIAGVSQQLWQAQQAQIQTMTATIATLEAQTAKLTKTLHQQHSQVNHQQQTLDQLDQTWNRTQTALQQRLNAQSERLATLSGSNRHYWMLKEARYLLRLANHRRLTDRDTAGITGLLESADALLRKTDMPGLFPIRDRIRQDILALSLTPTIDREGIYLQLSSLSAHIQQLSLLPLINAPTPAHTADPTDSQITADHKRWYHTMWDSIKRTLGTLNDYIRITHHDQRLIPWFSSTHEHIIRQRAALLLEQAQFALLKEEEKPYHDSLNRLLQWVEHYYGGLPEKSALIDTIHHLRDTPVVQNLPDISDSLAQLTQYIHTANTHRQSESTTDDGDSAS